MKVTTWVDSEEANAKIAALMAELERLRGVEELYTEAKRQLFDPEGPKMQLAKAQAELERLREKLTKANGIIMAMQEDEARLRRIEGAARKSLACHYHSDLAAALEAE